jgi:hypothetical protein
MGTEEEVVEVDEVDSKYCRTPADNAIYERLMKRFETMGDEAKAMLRLFWLLQGIGGVTAFTPAEGVGQELRVSGSPGNAAYGDPWIAGFADCLEMVVDHS